MLDHELFKEEFAAWAEVILPLAVPVNFTYGVPAAMLDEARPGVRAEVAFGGAKKYAGIIKALVPKPEFPVKPILNVLDEEPLVYEHQLQLWSWMSDYYMCNEGDVMAAALPANFKLSSETILIYNEDCGEDFSMLDDEAFMVAEALLMHKKLRMQEVLQILDGKSVYRKVKQITEAGICYIFEDLAEKYKVRSKNFITLHPDYENDAALNTLLNEWKGAPKQMELLLSFIHLHRTEGEVTQKALLKKSGATAAQLKALCDKGILLSYKRSVDRVKQLPKKVDIDFELTPEQAEALAEIEAGFAANKPGLLHGVTGSGKTQLYIRLIEKYFKQGKQSLYLLPEIALTTQIIRRLQKHFGGNIAIYHSRFNQQERVELWNKIRSGEIKIVLGARSALFLPFQNLGLVIVDEEHDSSFKQYEPAPRYHARDAAIWYANKLGAHVLLGSATPSLESFFNARSGKYFYTRLTHRFGELELPEIKIVNTAKVVTKGKVMISPPLQAAIEEAIKNDKQVIIFQNRRGYNPYLICGVCGNIPQCEHCDVSLTLHKYSNKLHCHYCGSTYPKPVACNRCGSVNWVEKNFGTEKLEEQLEELFPKARIARMDMDSTKGRHAQDSLIRLFEERRIDILVGTQMVVKGLDFEHLHLVGIADADGLLSFSDLRVNERAFQLMEQVSGRAGRKHKSGEVVIQTLQPKHPVLQFVKDHDYNAFYDWEIEKRHEFYYPPFSRLIRLHLKHKDKIILENGSRQLAENLRQDFGEFVTGPASPVIGRVRNQYIMEIMIKLSKDKRTESLKKVIRNHINLVLAEKQYKSIHIFPDVDPI